MKSRSWILPALLFLLIDCRTDQSPELEILRGPDYFALRNDSAWVYASNKDTQTVRILLPLMKQGLLRGSWFHKNLDMAGTPSLAFGVKDLELKAIRVSESTSRESLYTMLFSETYIWNARHEVDSLGNHFVLNHQTIGGPLVHYKLDILSNVDSVYFDCSGISL